MVNLYDEIEIEDFEFDEQLQRFSYPCPCGDIFTIDLQSMLSGKDIACCETCSLKIRIIFDELSLFLFLEILQKNVVTNNETTYVH